LILGHAKNEQRRNSNKSATKSKKSGITNKKMSIGCMISTRQHYFKTSAVQHAAAAYDV